MHKPAPQPSLLLQCRSITHVFKKLICASAQQPLVGTSSNQAKNSETWKPQSWRNSARQTPHTVTLEKKDIMDWQGHAVKLTPENKHIRRKVEIAVWEEKLSKGWWDCAQAWAPLLSEVWSGLRRNQKWDKWDVFLNQAKQQKHVISALQKWDQVTQLLWKLCHKRHVQSCFASWWKVQCTRHHFWHAGFGLWELSHDNSLQAHAYQPFKKDNERREL
jgi:hypothetical protein